jgi:hypothetical protein
LRGPLQTAREIHPDDEAGWPRDPLARLKTSSLDKFTLDLNKHVVSGVTPASRTPAGVTIPAKPEGLKKAKK